MKNKIPRGEKPKLGAGDSVLIQVGTNKFRYGGRLTSKELKKLVKRKKKQYRLKQNDEGVVDQIKGFRHD
jgi:hypothetical protein